MVVWFVGLHTTGFFCKKLFTLHFIGNLTSIQTLLYEFFVFLQCNQQSFMHMKSCRNTRHMTLQSCLFHILAIFRILWMKEVQIRKILCNDMSQSEPGRRLATGYIRRNQEGHSNEILSNCISGIRKAAVTARHCVAEGAIQVYNHPITPCNTQMCEMIALSKVNRMSISESYTRSAPSGWWYADRPFETLCTL